MKLKVLSAKLMALLKSEHSGDALRNTLTAICPGILLFYMGDLHGAIAVGLGVILTSLTDLPGNRKDKWLSATWCIPTFFITTIATGFALPYSWLLVMLLMLAGFIFTMYAFLGSRIGTVGIMALITMSFTIGLWPVNVIAFSLHIVGGAIFYYIVSFVQVNISPLRSLRFARADSLKSMANLLQAKSQFYDENIPLERAYKDLSALHVVVSDQHEVIRTLLFQEQKLIYSDNKYAKYWLGQVHFLTDLYEQLTALDYDYDAIRNTLKTLDVLPNMRKIIGLISNLMRLLPVKKDVLIRENEFQQTRQELEIRMEKLYASAAKATLESNKMIYAFVRNVRQIMTSIEALANIDNKQAHINDRQIKEKIRDFVSLPPRGLKSLWSRRVMELPVFLFAIRLAILFGLGGMVGVLLPEFRFSYWILLTIAIVARPAFVVTKRRNGQRLWGTLCGLVVSVILLLCISHVLTLLLIAALCLFLFFLFNRVDYGISVLFITITAIVGLSIHEGNTLDILGSRLFFTIIGCGLAIGGWYLLPTKQIKGVLALANAVIEQNQRYFTLAKETLYQNVDPFQLRLERKQAHTTLAAFSDSIHQLQNEPKSNRNNDWKEVSEFHSLAYRINSLIIGFSLSSARYQQNIDVDDIVQIDDQALYIESLLSELKSSLPSI